MTKSIEHIARDIDLVKRLNGTYDSDSGEFYSALNNVLEFAAQSMQQVNDVKWVSVDKDLVLFLLGEKDFDGVWFGDIADDKTGRFWWRTDLRKCLP